ncbi:hypothetical protein AB1Y20_003946 [Prymnesium parvum]|uniref:Nonsense-mediated mRNA decay factor SMG8 n=1 Tax=Prymnesium parvum TaxID=97485 RepID=A0AB34J968_PRYPA
MCAVCPLRPRGADASLAESASPLLVIGIVGHDAASPAALANRLIDAPVFPLRAAAAAHASAAAAGGVATYHDRERSVLYLSAAAPLASAELPAAAAALAAAASPRALHALLSAHAHAHARALLAVFQLSHAVLFVHPAASPPPALLRTLRVLAALKQLAAPRLPRPHAPPALGFVFDGRAVRKLLSSSKQLARAATGGAHGLFLLPKDGLVHVQRPSAPPLAAADAASSELSFGRYLHMLSLPSPPPPPPLRAWNALATGPASASAPPPVLPSAAAAALRKFVVRLCEPARACLSDGGLLAAAAAKPSALPSGAQWAAACRQMAALLEAEGEEGGAADDALCRRQLARLVDVEEAFSCARGRAALPAAKEMYLRDLPPQYPEQTHEAHVAVAEEYLRAAVPGPAYEATLEKLRQECLSVWKAGRQLCGALSLTGRPCTLPVHALLNSSSVPPEGLAAASGKLKVGDRILSVNGQPSSGHAGTTALLKAAVGSLRLEVERPAEEGGQGATSSSLLEVHLYLPEKSARLGLVLTSAHPQSGVPVIAALGTSKSAGARAPRPHSSGFESLRACQCGRTLSKRGDPFSLDAALNLLTAQCCEELPFTILPLRHSTLRLDPPPPTAPAPPTSSSTAATSQSARLTEGEADAPPTPMEAEGAAAATQDGKEDGDEPPPLGGGRDERTGCCGRLSLLETAELNGRGVQQEGFLPQLNQLTAATMEPADHDSASSALPSLLEVYGSSSSSAVASMVQQLRHASLSPAAVAEALVGTEFECRHGHRFFPPGRTAGRASPLDAELPLVRPCAAEGCAAAAQLQRLYVRTPDAPPQLLLQPTVAFDEAELLSASAALLPRAALVVCCLPYVYARRGEPLLTAATALEPACARQAALLPRWLRLVPSAAHQARLHTPPPRVAAFPRVDAASVAWPQAAAEGSGWCVDSTGG